jgi:hypothetical protein
VNAIRSRFFWRGAEDKFKYHMVRWDVVCRPREFGGLGILNTQIFNEYMMAKWIWKLYEQKDSLMARILRAKYMRHCDFSDQRGLVAPNSRKAFTKSNIYSSGEQYTRWVMVGSLNFGMMSSW